MDITTFGKMYHGKGVVVTGAGGFIGSHLAELLTRLGANVTAFVHYNSLGSFGWLKHSDVKNDMEVVLGDIRDPFQCNSLVQGKDLVFNLAALIGIPYSYEAPAAYFETNMKGAMNVLEAVKGRTSTRVIQMSTSEVYGSAVTVPLGESNRLQPQSPYSASKIASDSVALSYFHSYGTEVIVGRPFNTYGPRQSLRAIIPTIISQLLTGNRKIMLGNTDSARDFTYVEDTCRLLCQLAVSDGCVGESVNIGTGLEIKIKDLFARISDLMCIEARIEIANERVRPPLSEVNRLVCNNRKLKNLTGESPDIDLDEGLKRTIDWFRMFSDDLAEATPRYVV